MSNNVMKALRFAELGPPLVLRIECAAIPEPGARAVVIHVKAAACGDAEDGAFSCDRSSRPERRRG